MFKLTFQSILQTLMWTVIAGIMYPLVMTVFLQLAFPYQAGGSLVMRDGKVVGSELLAQGFPNRQIFLAASVPRLQLWHRDGVALRGVGCQ